MEEAMIARLLADPGVAAYASTRIYPVSRPQGDLLPAVTLQRIDGGPTYSDDGETGLGNARVQIDTWAATYEVAKTLSRAVTASLSAFHGIVGGIDFQTILLNDARDFREAGGNQVEYLFRVSLDFNVWWRT
ncbi:Protein of unknown function [Filomicrobium insigne]|uniref:DUF3168 domain-containing protein n=1 Tax=Filomicrobium insigne TaxID=418854 RepID=A0A1H0SFT6_9HYPH|nr:DUF3168 domain-containing protein [Filomicrobium insigne]SDP40613.1 Protein of unknown function [Filomicrobium insigne]